MKRLALLVLAASLSAIPLGFTTGCAVTSGRESVGNYASDKEITARVKSALLGDPDVAGTQVNVTTYKGVVQLSGFVNSARTKQRAGEIASSTPGVVRVENSLVLPTGR